MEVHEIYRNYHNNVQKRYIYTCQINFSPISAPTFLYPPAGNWMGIVGRKEYYIDDVENSVGELPTIAIV